LFQLKVGEQLSLRGLYGKDVEDTDKKKVVVVAGGTGVAIVPGLVKKYHAQGKEVIVYYGITNKDEVVMREEIEKYAEYIPVVDEGVLGRVLHVMKEDLNSGKLGNISDICFCNMGPLIMMKKAIEIQEEAGAKPKDILNSLETNTMCGIGLCSECTCGGKLTCQEGTFISKAFLDDKGLDITDIE